MHRIPLHTTPHRAGILLLVLTLATVVLVRDFGRLRPRAAAAGEQAVLPWDSEPYRRARAELPPRFATYQTTRYVILSDAPANWTQVQAQLLERAHHQYRRYCRRLDIEPAPLRHKLVAVLFEHREHYRAFARNRDNVGDVELSGYYAPANDRLVLYRVESNPSIALARSALAEMAAEVDRLGYRVREAERNGRSDDAAALGRRHIEWREHLRTQSAKVDAFSTETSMATAIHEAVHQLLFHTGVQSPRVQYPLWISEGLATGFETTSPSAAFGPDHEHAPRRRQVAELHARDALLPLDELVAIMRLPDEGTERTCIVYDQSYGLVTWMTRFRRDELRHYLDLLRAEKPGVPTEARQRRLFELAFGDIDSVERAWHRHLAQDTRRVGLAARNE